MKGKIAALIAGLVLGSAATAGAGMSVYWLRGGSGYRCQGTSSGVICNSGRYDVGVTKDFVFVQQHGSKLTFGCHKWQSFGACVSD